MLTDRAIVSTLTRPGLSLTAAAAAVSLGAFTARTVEASGFDHRLVAADSTWVAHIDMERLLASDLGGFALKHAEDFDADEHLHEFEAQTGLDPLEVLYGITVYGVGDPGEEPVVLIVGSDRILAKLHEFAEMKDAEVKRHRALGGVVFEIDDDALIAVRTGRRDRALYVFSEDRHALTEAMEVIDGDEPNLSDVGADRFRRPTHDAMIFAAVSDADFDDMIGDAGPASGLLRGADGVVMEIGERDGVLGIVVSLATEDAEKAQAARTMVQGLMLLAQGAMQSDVEGIRDEQAKMAAELMQGLNLRADGRHLTISFEYETKRLIEMAKEANKWNGADWDDDDDDWDGDDWDHDKKDHEPDHEWRRSGDHKKKSA